MRTNRSRCHPAGLADVRGQRLRTRSRRGTRAAFSATGKVNRLDFIVCPVTPILGLARAGVALSAPALTCSFLSGRPDLNRRPLDPQANGTSLPWLLYSIPAGQHHVDSVRTL